MTDRFHPLFPSARNGRLIVVFALLGVVGGSVKRWVAALLPVSEDVWEDWLDPVFFGAWLAGSFLVVSWAVRAGKAPWLIRSSDRRSG